MSKNLSPQDWINISAYLDGRLAESENIQVENRLKSDPQFGQAFREIRHTRTLLRSLPAKRAPRNFTLSQKYAKTPTRRWGIQSIMGLASASAALALVVLFVSVNFFSISASRSAAPIDAAMPKVAYTTGAATANDNSAPPMIITWNQATGMGGGGGGDAASALNVRPLGGGYGGGAPETTSGLNPAASTATEVPLTTTETPPTTLTVPLPSTETPLITSEPTQAATEVPQANAESATVDPSTLILGLPQAGTGGEEINQNIQTPAPVNHAIPASTIWMISLGALSLICGTLAFVLRRR